MSKWTDLVGADLSAYKTETSASGGIFSNIGNTIVDKGRALLSGVIEGARDVINTALPSATAALAKLSFSGATGNFTSANENIVLSGKFQIIAETAPNKKGSPCYKNLLISSIPNGGFVMCENPVFAAGTATVTEEKAVEEFLKGGFYYE